MSAPFQTIPITHLDLTSQRGKQVMQDAFDQLVAMFSAGRIDVGNLAPTVRRAITRVGTFPAVKVYKNANQLLTTDITTVMTWNATEYNDDTGIFDVASDHVRILAPGLYIATTELVWAIRADATLRVAVLAHRETAGGTIVSQYQVNQPNFNSGAQRGCVQAPGGIFRVEAAGEVIDLAAKHTATASINVESPSNLTHMTIAQISAF